MPTEIVGVSAVGLGTGTEIYSQAGLMMTKGSRKIKAIDAFEDYQKRKDEWVRNNSRVKYLALRKSIRPLLRFLLYVQRKICGFRVEVLNRCPTEKDKPAVFAVTHIGKWDFEIVYEQVPEHFHVVAADFIHMHGNVEGTLLDVNGVIWVNENSREDKKNTKERMKQILDYGDNILVFPEGDWNLSENEPVRDIAYGTADVAVQTGAVVYPIAVEQYGRRFVINMGSGLHAEDYEDKRELTVTLRDILATLKWEIWERQGMEGRSGIPEN